MYDGSELTSGLTDAEGDLREFAATAERASDDVNAALRSVDDGVRSSLSTGGTLDDGTTSASRDLQDFAANAKEEVPGAMLDMQDGVASAASGIAAALAPMGTGGLVLAGLLAGFTIMKNRADAAAQAMRDSINEAVSAIEVKARTTNQAIERMYEKQLTFQKTLEKFGDGDATKGYEKLAHYADVLGVETEDVVAFIQGRFTPAAANVAELIKRQGDLLREQGGTLRDNNGVLTEQQTVAGTLNRLAAEEREVRERAGAQLRDNRDYLADIRREQDQVKDSGKKVADDAERAAAAWERVQSAQLNIVRHQANINGAGAGGALAGL